MHALEYFDLNSALPPPPLACMAAPHSYLLSACIQAHGVNILPVQLSICPALLAEGDGNCHFRVYRVQESVDVDRIHGA